MERGPIRGGSLSGGEGIEVGVSWGEGSYRGVFLGGGGSYREGGTLEGGPIEGGLYRRGGHRRGGLLGGGVL